MATAAALATLSECLCWLTGHVPGKVQEGGGAGRDTVKCAPSVWLRAGQAVLAAVVVPIARRDPPGGACGTRDVANDFLHSRVAAQHQLLRRISVNVRRSLVLCGSPFEQVVEVVVRNNHRDIWCASAAKRMCVQVEQS